MSYIEGADRQQGWLLPERLEDYVSDDNPVRFLDAFVNSLDLAALGFQRATPSDTGRPPYQPGDWLRLSLYGYLNRLRSRIGVMAPGGFGSSGTGCWWRHPHRDSWSSRLR